MTWAGSAASLRPSFCKWQRGIMASGWWGKVSKRLQKLRHTLNTTVFVQGRKAEGRVGVIRLWQGGVTDLMLLFLWSEKGLAPDTEVMERCMGLGPVDRDCLVYRKTCSTFIHLFTFTKIWG